MSEIIAKHAWGLLAHTAAFRLRIVDGTARLAS